MAPNSNSKVSFARTTLPYPIFAADFDPYNRGYLVVGGGGGEGRSGVPNQITVLDVSDRSKITNAVDIELTRDEDSVQSLGTLATKDGLVVLAGINGSVKDQDAGKNEHFRSFNVKYPPRKKEESDAQKPGSWEVLGRRSLFKPASGPKKEQYQRLLRLSPAQKSETGSKRIGAIATGLAKDSQIIVFNATSSTPDKTDILTEITLPSGLEAADLDITTINTSEFSLTYCTDYDIYEQTFQYDFKKKQVTNKIPNGPRRVFQMPSPDGAEKPGSRSRLRCVRFLNNQNIVALCNKPDKKGAELRVFHLYPSGPAIEVLQKTLPRHVKQAASMDICQFGADSLGNEQIAVAVAGADISIEIFTINFQAKSETFAPFRSYLSMKDVHQHQMTKVAFSPYHPPLRTLSADKAISKGSAPGKFATGPQFVRLASVSYGNSVVVDTFPLEPLDASDKNTRYVLSHPGDERMYKFGVAALISLLVVVIAFFVQAFLGDTAEAGLYYELRNLLNRPAVHKAPVIDVDEVFKAQSAAAQAALNDKIKPSSAETVVAKVTEVRQQPEGDADWVVEVRRLLAEMGQTEPTVQEDDQEWVAKLRELISGLGDQEE